MISLEISDTRVKYAEPNVKKLMDPDSYHSCRQGLVVKKENLKVGQVGFQQKKKKKAWLAKNKNYRKFTVKKKDIL